jgi:hypothetical protein
MDAGILQRTRIFRLGVDHLRPRAHALLRINAVVLAGQRCSPGWSATYPPQGEEPYQNKMYANSSGHSKSFGLQLKLLRALLSFHSLIPERFRIVIHSSMML